MDVSLGNKLFGGLLIIVGANVWFTADDTAEIIAGIFLIGIGLAVVTWGFRHH